MFVHEDSDVKDVKEIFIANPTTDCPPFHSVTNKFIFEIASTMWTGVRNKNRVQFPSREKGAKKPELPEIKTIERLFTEELRRSLELTLISGVRHHYYQDNLAYSSLVTFGTIRLSEYFFKISFPS